jgi:hypothetical protein
LLCTNPLEPRACADWLKPAGYEKRYDLITLINFYNYLILPQSGPAAFKLITRWFAGAVGLVCAVKLLFNIRSMPANRDFRTIRHGKAESPALTLSGFQANAYRLLFILPQWQKNRQ